MLFARQRADPAGQYGIDFAYWYRAATDVAAGISPYPQRYLEGPVPVTDFGYKYPPTFGQSLFPLTRLPLLQATDVWALIQAALAFLAVWLAGLLGGARRTLEHALWSGVAVALYLPIFDTVWKGNVSAVQAFQVAVLLSGGAVAGISLASAVLLKTTPIAIVPAAFAHRGRVLWAAIGSSLGAVALSMLFAPEAWLDYFLIQPNLLGGSYVVGYNLLPASLAAIVLPDLPALAAGLRLIAFTLGLAAVIAAVVSARRQGGWPAAVLLGTIAMLLIPGALWYHYLAVLLPPAAFAWARATANERFALVGGAACITVALVWLPLATFGAMLLATATLRALWPRRPSAGVLGASEPT
jgi:hypothetical protein